jgi:putative transposase
MEHFRSREDGCGEKAGRRLLRAEKLRRDNPRAQAMVFWYIECFYNPRRRHSSLDMLSPIDYEQRHQQEAIAA